jgi:hypothetical protein
MCRSWSKPGVFRCIGSGEAWTRPCRRHRNVCPLTRYKHRLLSTTGCCLLARTDSRPARSSRRPDRRQLFRLLMLSCRSSLSKDIKLLVLRQEISVLRRQVNRPQIRPEERMSLAVLQRLRPTSERISSLVTPATLRRRHRELVRRKWRRPHRVRSRHRVSGASEAKAGTETGYLVLHRSEYPKDPDWRSDRWSNQPLLVHADRLQSLRGT